MRIGFGYDVHKLKKGRKFILGGVEIKHHKGIIAHSDGDVLIHAICDALLGALALGDIGKHFPDNKKEYSNINSRILLIKTMQLIGDMNYKVSNIDSTICLQTPKLQDYIPTMRQNIAEDLGIDTSQVSIKATTTEKLGFTGEEKGLEAYAVVLVQKIP